MRKAFQALILIVIAAVAALGQPAQCRVSKTFYTLSGQPDKNATVTVFSIQIGGTGNPAYANGRLVLRTNASGQLLGADGSTVGVDLPQGAIVRIYSGANAQLPQLAANPNAGTQYQVPNKSTANLDELIWNLATIKTKGALLVGGTNGIASQFSPCADGQTIIWEAAQALGVKCGTAGAVLSVFGRTGAVVAANNDYAFSQISGTLGGSQFPAALPAIDAALATNLNASSLTSGTVPLARIAGLTDTQIAAGAAIAQSKIANLTSDLAAKEAALTFSAPLIRTVNMISGQVASGSQAGFLSATDWNAFNGKQAAGSYITGLTGDVTATGPGSVAATVARLQGRDLASTAPTNGQAIVWNNGLSRWEPGTVAAGTAINSTDGVLPYRMNSTSFSDSPLSVGADSALVQGNRRTHYLTRTLPTVTTSAVDIGTFAMTQGVGMLRITGLMEDSSAGARVSKAWFLPLNWAATGGVWQTVTPLLSKVGNVGPADDFDLEASQLGGTLTLRLRPTVNPAARTVYLMLEFDSILGNVFTPSTTVNTGITAPTTSYTGGLPANLGTTTLAGYLTINNPTANNAGLAIGSLRLGPDSASSSAITVNTDKALIFGQANGLDLSALTERGRISTTGLWGINSATPAAQLDVRPSSSSTVGQVIQLASGQSARALNIRDSATNFLSGFDSAGRLEYAAGITATTATAGAQTLPANPAGFMIVTIGGTQYKVPYYNN